MKKWVLAIFGINDSLDKRCEAVERRIEKLSLNPALPAARLYVDVVALNKKKADLINLRVLYNRMVDALSEEDLAVVKELVLRRGKRRRGDDLACEGSVRGGIRGFGVGCKSLAEIFGVCERTIFGAGFDEKRLERVYPFCG